VLGFARDGDDACVVILKVRDGKLLARDQRFLEQVEGEQDADILAAYLAGGYMVREERARELILPFEVSDHDLIARSLVSTRLLIPQRGPRRELADLAEQNARHLMEEM
jgi:excinuclease ABC subunit C